MSNEELLNAVRGAFSAAPDTDPIPPPQDEDEEQAPAGQEPEDALDEETADLPEAEGEEPEEGDVEQEEQPEKRREEPSAEDIYVDVEQVMAKPGVIRRLPHRRQVQVVEALVNTVRQYGLYVQQVQAQAQQYLQQQVQEAQRSAFELARRYVAWEQRRLESPDEFQVYLDEHPDEAQAYYWLRSQMTGTAPDGQQPPQAQAPAQQQPQQDPLMYYSAAADAIVQMLRPYPKQMEKLRQNWNYRATPEDLDRLRRDVEQLLVEARGGGGAEGAQNQGRKPQNQGQRSQRPVVPGTRGRVRSEEEELDQLWNEGPEALLLAGLKRHAKK